MSIKCIVFDVGGVVIDVDFGQFFAALPSLASERARANRDEVIRRFADYEGSCGIVSERQLFENLRGAAGAELTDMELTVAVNAVLGREKAETCAAISALATHYTVSCLTNTNSIHWEHLNAHYPVFKHFEPKLASHLLGFSKPDPRIYQAAQEALGVTGAEILFFDDKLENVTAAEEAGWRGCRFVDSAGFFADLRRHGVERAGPG